MISETGIRRATQADAPALAGLLAAVDAADGKPEQPDEFRQAQVARHLALVLAGDGHCLFVAEEENRLLGYSAVHFLPYLIFRGPEAYVSELFLHPESRGRGIGTRLLDAVVAEAAARGCVRLSLLNWRGRDSYRRDFYVKQGWTERPDVANFVLYLREPHR